MTTRGLFILMAIALSLATRIESARAEVRLSIDLAESSGARRASSIAHADRLLLRSHGARLLERCDAMQRHLDVSDEAHVLLAIDERGHVINARATQMMHAGRQDDRMLRRWRGCIANALSEGRFARGAEGAIVVWLHFHDDPAATVATDSTADVGASSDPEAASREMIRSVVHRHVPEVRRCFEHGLAEHADLAGEIAVRFTIRSDGTLGGAEAIRDSLHAEDVTTCVMTSVLRWRFSPPGAGEPLVVTYPFHLRGD